MTNRTDDSLVRAGVFWRAYCGLIGYPADAAWLGNGLILAAYLAVCSHTRPLVTIVDPAGELPGDITAEKYLPGRRCAGTNRRGRPCRSRARAGSDYCPAHQDDERRARGDRAA